MQFVFALTGLFMLKRWTQTSADKNTLPSGLKGMRKSAKDNHSRRISRSDRNDCISHSANSAAAAAVCVWVWKGVKKLFAHKLAPTTWGKSGCWFLLSNHYLPSLQAMKTERDDEEKNSYLATDKNSTLLMEKDFPSSSSPLPHHLLFPPSSSCSWRCVCAQPDDMSSHQLNWSESTIAIFHFQKVYHQ